jgi:hypothetical protein
VPLTRPAEISNGVSLSDKLARQERAFVSEQAAFDARLGRNGFVEMLSPNKDCITGICSQDDVRAWPDELGETFSSWPLLAAVVAQVEGEAGLVSVLRDEPVRHIKGSTTFDLRLLRLVTLGAKESPAR